MKWGEADLDPETEAQPFYASKTHGVFVMASSKKIPSDVQKQAEEILERFNNEQLKDTGIRYVFRFKGKYLYIDRQDLSSARPSPICRLQYTGDPSNWLFDVYLYSDNCYDPEEGCFPGRDLVDGTIEGALYAGLEAYPP
jgi:hypothetical protein